MTTNAKSANVAAFAVFLVNSSWPGESIKINFLFSSIAYLCAISIVMPCFFSSIRPSKNNEKSILRIFGYFFNLIIKYVFSFKSNLPSKVDFPSSMFPQVITFKMFLLKSILLFF